MKSEKIKSKRKRTKILSKKLRRSIHKIKPLRKMKSSGSKKLKRSVKKIKQVKRSNHRRSIKQVKRRSNNKRSIKQVKSKRKLRSVKLKRIDGFNNPLGGKTISKKFSVYGKIDIEVIITSIKTRLQDIKNLKKKINNTSEFFSKNKQNMNDYVAGSK